MEDWEESSRVRDLTEAEGTRLRIEFMTSSILEAVREARINWEGECLEMATAICSPRELGLTPTRRTVDGD
jgi:hypothetical protein